MEKIIKKDLDFLQTQEYFLDHIDGGGFLGKSLLQSVEFQNGRFFILLPENACLDQLYQLSVGGINPLISTNQICHTKEGKEFILKMQITTSREVSQRIKQFLEICDEHFAICEDVTQAPQDPHVMIPNVGVHFYNDHVYYSLCNKNSIEEINFVIKRTDYIWHSLVVLSSGVKLPHMLRTEDFSSICVNVQYVLTSAHDSENFVFWERDFNR